MRTLTFVSFCCFFGFSSTVSASEASVPSWVVEQWETLIGVWVADNAAYKTDEASMDAFGVEWRWGVGKKSLVGRLYGIKNGEEVATFWEYREFWHPGEGRLILAQYGRDGTYGAGPHYPMPDGSTEMVQTFYDGTTGDATESGHRSELTPTEQRTKSFDIEEGKRIDRRSYIWRRIE